MGICNSKKDYELYPPKYNHNQNRWPNKKKIVTPTKTDKSKPVSRAQPETHQNLIPLINKKLQSKPQLNGGKPYCSTYKVAQYRSNGRPQPQGLIQINGNILQSRKGGKSGQIQAELSGCSTTLNGNKNIKEQPNRNEKDIENNRRPPSLLIIGEKLQSTEIKFNGQHHYRR